MKQYWRNPPKDKLEVRKKEERFFHLRKAKDYKENCLHLNRLDKTYRKKFNVESPYLYYSDVEKYMTTFNIYKSMNYLVKNGYFDIDYIGKRKIIPSEQVKEELFRREMCTFRDWLIWDHDKSRENAKRNKFNVKRRSKRFYIKTPCGRKIWYGTYDTKRSTLARDVAIYLLKNSYIFDKSSPYYLTDVQLRKLVKEKMMSRSFEKLNLKDYLLEFKGKMLKKYK